MSGNDTSQVLGLDIGTSRIVVARRAGQPSPGSKEDWRYESQLNAFVNIPFSKITASTLRQESIPHTIEGQEILVHGNESERFAGLLNAEIRRPMTRGMLDPREPESLKVIREILTRMLGPASPGASKVCFTVPAPPWGAAAGDLTYHEATIRQLLTEFGYESSSINEGLAVVYGELQDSNYTGIGISCGGGLCNVCLAYLSVPALSFSIPKAGDYIDASAARVTGERANRIRLAKEDSFHFNGFHGDKIRQVIAVYYDDMLQSLVSALTEAFTHTSNLPKFNRPIGIVLSGGTAMPAGFRDRFEALIRQQAFPIPISGVKLAENPLYSTAKGALACALSE